MSQDDEWDWLSCGSGDETEAGGERDRRVRRSTAQVMVRVERAVGAMEKAAEAITAAEDESKRWRIIAILIMAAQFMQALPEGIKNGTLNFAAKHGLRAAILAVITHLLHATLRKMYLAKTKRAAPVIDSTTTTTTTTTPPTLLPEKKQQLDDESDPKVLPENLKKAMELNMNKSWTNLYSGKAVWDAMDVDWNGGHKVTRFTANDVKCSVEFFMKKMIDESPKGQRTFDDLLENYTVLEDNGSVVGKKIYMSFNTPVWGIGQRDLVTCIKRALITPEEAAQYSISPAGEPLDSENRHDFKNIKNTLVLGTVSTVHEKAPENPKYVRAVMNTQGYIVTPLTKDTCRIIEVIAMDVKGSLPGWAVAAGAKRVYERFNRMLKYVEGEFAKEA